MQIKEGLIIAPNYIKKEILKKLSKEKKLINIKIMNKKEFIQNYYGKSKKEALYFIMQKYNLNYEVAKNYLDNIFINSKTIKPYFDILKKENLIETNPYFKNNLKNIKVIGYSDIDPYILKDPLTENDIILGDDDKTDMVSVQTGDMSYFIILLFSAVAIISLVVAFKSKKEICKMLTVTFCIGMCLQIVNAKTINKDVNVSLDISLGGNISQANIEFKVSYEAPEFGLIPNDDGKINVHFTTDEIEGWTGTLVLTNSDGKIVNVEEGSMTQLGRKVYDLVDYEEDTTYTVTLYDSNDNTCYSDTFSTDYFYDYVAN